MAFLQTRKRERLLSSMHITIKTLQSKCHEKADSMLLLDNFADCDIFIVFFNKNYFVLLLCCSLTTAFESENKHTKWFPLF